MSPAKLARWLHLAHRWLGIWLGLIVLLWFVSGVVMLFVARPQLTDDERLAALPALAAERIRVSPLAAWQALGRQGWPDAVRLNMAGDRPAYRFLAQQRWTTVYADDACRLEEVDANAARRLAAPYLGDTAVRAMAPLRRDQWTVYRQFDAWRPFWRIELADGRDFYLASGSGEVVLDTSPSERAWNWLGSVVHWLYFTPLRQHGEVWRGLVLSLSCAALLMTLAGLWLGWQRMRLQPTYPGGRLTPYRSGWKRWHHLLGLGGGLCVVTWLLSGWLSLAPFGLARGSHATPAEQHLLAGGVLDGDSLDWLPEIGAATGEVEWLRFGGQTLARLRHADATAVIVTRAGTRLAQIGFATIRQAGEALRPAARLEATWLNEPDARYFPLRHQPRPFPVARLSFDDEARSVFYVDPQTGRIALHSNRHDTAHRWLYQALHRLDFPALLAPSWQRDGAILALSLLGGGLCLSGCVLGWQRLSRRRPPAA
ncbi:MAG: hypothetical protein D3M94_18000 [Rhodocyclales bacterium GT-UBC]|nr:MAG: hypothetical protein D3M94_18000 [Rhodocyclales bacterium GT-UBC]